MDHFGLFLVKKGLASSQHIVKALDTQRGRQMPIGRIALEYGLLDMKQIFEILNLQADATHVKFCAIALDLRYLDKQQVNFLLAIQRSRRPPIGEILVEMGVISPEQLAVSLAEFEKVQDKDSTISDTQLMC
jgi:hypothetical protein